MHLKVMGEFIWVERIWFPSSIHQLLAHMYMTPPSTLRTGPGPTRLEVECLLWPSESIWPRWLAEWSSLSILIGSVACYYLISNRRCGNHFASISILESISIFNPLNSSALVPTLLSFSLEQDRWPGTRFYISSLHLSCNIPLVKIGQVQMHEISSRTTPWPTLQNLLATLPRYVLVPTQRIRLGLIHL
jgi:hypothetical protein